MIIIFGPPGSGKSIQGQMLAARMGWRWLSAGQLLRDEKDPNLLAIMRTGELVPHERTNSIMDKAIERASGISQIILDGYPRAIEQAEWLIQAQKAHNRKVSLIITLDVPREEIIRRLDIRGRSDDESEAIEQRINLYKEESIPVVEYLQDNGVKAATVDGVGAVGQVHDRIVSVLQEHGLA